MTWTIHNGDCLEVLRTLPAASVDAVVTDPPYGLAFMGKRWDYDVPAVEVWQECLRVLKPGGHLLAFAGTRTQHRMAVRIEDAGFEIRDIIAWVYGSGFPKSLDVSKAIDKGEGENKARQLRFTEWMRSTGITSQQIAEATGTSMASHYLTAGSQPAIATADLFDKMRPHLPDVPEEIERLVAERTGIEWTAYRNREVVGTGTSGISTRKDLRNDNGTVWGASSSEFAITAPATEAARQWSGWGTALKPALEPITVARKPLIGTVAANVLEHGTGAINVDGCRVGADGGTTRSEQAPYADSGWRTGHKVEPLNAGRWPANLIHDGSEEVLAGFPDAKGAVSNGRKGKAGIYDDGIAAAEQRPGYADTGSAARFFYCAKASKRDRDEGLGGFEVKRTGGMSATADGSMLTGSGNERTTARANVHPTVKPTDLMRYLCRLVTPPNGTILDPFTGSGSTGKAAMLEGFQFIGIEREAEYCEIARARISKAERDVSKELL